MYSTVMQLILVGTPTYITKATEEFLDDLFSGRGSMTSHDVRGR